MGRSRTLGRGKRPRYGVDEDVDTCYPTLMHVQKIFIGGWFQRTTLHLSEIWEFLHHGESALDFDPKALANIGIILPYILTIE